MKAITELRQKYPLKDLLELSAFARSTFYYYLKEKRDKYAEAKAEIQNIYESSKNTYGYRRITLELRQRGYEINHKTVLKLMKILKIYGKQRKNKYKSYRGAAELLPIYSIENLMPTLLIQNFPQT